MQDTDNKAPVESSPPSPPSPVPSTKWRVSFIAALLSPGSGLAASALTALLMG